LLDLRCSGSDAPTVTRYRTSPRQNTLTLTVARSRASGFVLRREAVIEQTQTLIGAQPNSTPSTSPLVRVGFGSRAEDSAAAGHRSFTPICGRSRAPLSCDFVPWRFSDAGRPSVSRARHCRRPKTCTGVEIEERSGANRIPIRLAVLGNTRHDQKARVPRPRSTENRRPHSSGCSLSHSVLLPASGVRRSHPLRPSRRAQHTLPFTAGSYAWLSARRRLDTAWRGPRLNRCFIPVQLVCHDIKIPVCQPRACPAVVDHRLPLARGRRRMGCARSQQLCRRYQQPPMRVRYRSEIREERLLTPV